MASLRRPEVYRLGRYEMASLDGKSSRMVLWMLSPLNRSHMVYLNLRVMEK